MSSPGVSHSLLTETGPLKTGLNRGRIATYAIVFFVSLLVILALQQRSGSRSAELSGYPDESAHYVTGLMCRDYLLGGWRTESPVEFAENFYLHYPKVAIGHWPPAYYLVQFLWMAVFPTTISSLLSLQAILLAVTATLLFMMVRSRFGLAAAIVLCAVFLILRPTQLLASEIMSEPLLTLVTLLATWAIARYFEFGELRFMIWFVVFVEIAAHTKGSGLELAGMPILLAICLRRTDEFRKRSFWLAQVAMFAIMVPWQIFSWKMVHNGMVKAGLPQIVDQARDFVPSLAGFLGWPLLLAIACGTVLAFLPRNKSVDVLLVSCAVTVAVTFAFHSISPNGVEERRLYMAVPAALILAAFPVWRLLEAPRWREWAPAVLLALAAASVLPSWAIFHKVTVGYRPVSAWLLGNSGPGPDVVLISSDIDGEGMLVSEIAQLQPKPEVYVVRSTKLFENCDWLGEDCRLTVSGPAAAQQLMDSIPVRYLVVDRYAGLASTRTTDLLRRAIAARPDLWALRDTQAAVSPSSKSPGEILIYQRVGMAPPDHIRLRLDLSRMIGRFIGQ